MVDLHNLIITMTSSIMMFVSNLIFLRGGNVTW